MVKVLCRPATEFSITGPRLDDRLRTSVLEAAARYQATVGGSAALFEVLASPPRHVGLGSGTATVMACLEGLNELASTGATRAELGRMSGRGGASGTGVNGYWRGGWVVDAGQPRTVPVLPSGMQVPREPSLMTQHVRSPKWIVDLYLPPSCVGLSGLPEVELFRRAAADDSLESLHALSLLHHGLVPAIMLDDLPSFGDNMERFQAHSLKRLEIEYHGPGFAKYRASLASAYPCVAMSSMGPILAAFRGVEAPFPDVPYEPFLVGSSIANSGSRVKWVE